MFNPAIPILEAQDLVVSYGTNRILKGINLTVFPGEWVSLIGPNGSGKSTCLKALSGLLSISGGVVRLHNRAIHELTAKTVAQHLALLPQQPVVPEGLTVQQLVQLGRSPYQGWWQWHPSREDQDKVTQALVQTNLESFRHRSLESLSGGERQRAFLALALAQDPQVLLLDEPTTFLDLRYQLELLEVIKHLNQTQSLTVITVLHDLNLAARYSQRLALMHQGQIWAVGDPATILNSENLAAVYGIEASILQTPLGIQICPLNPSTSLLTPA
jgi:iron complex transport system ATP-binding protein